MERSLQPFLLKSVLVLLNKVSIQEAARAMCEQGTGSVVVTNGTELVGLLTDRDIACRCVALAESLSAPVESILSDEFYAVDESASLDDVIEVMKSQGVRRIPIYRWTRAGRQSCEGIVSVDDLIASSLISPEDLSEIVRSQITRRQKWRGASVQSEERKTKNLERFYAILRRHMGLGGDIVESVTYFVLKNIVRRLTYTGATQLASQLPESLKESLLDLPKGPDRAITRESLIAGLREKYKLSDEKTYEVLAGFWSGLEEFTHHSQPEKVLKQLPPDMEKLFGGRSDEGASLQ